MELMEYLPGYYKRSEYVTRLIGAYSEQINDVAYEEKSDEANAHITDASRRLDLHEKDVGLIVSTADSDEVRRARVISRLRGSNTATVQEIQELVRSYGFENASVEEHFSDYAAVICADTVSTDIFTDMSKAVNNMIPAHIMVSYALRNTPCKNTIYHALPHAAYRHTVITAENVSAGRLGTSRLGSFILGGR